MAICSSLIIVAIARSDLPFRGRSTGTEWVDFAGVHT
jgi:hypothetical protein